MPVIELAMAVNREMERRDQERYHILVPWIHGERQRRALNDAFGAESEQYPGETFFSTNVSDGYCPLFSATK